MPLFRCDEIANGRAAGFSVKGFARQYTRTFRLWGTKLIDGPITLIAEAQALGLLPFLFSWYVGPNGEYDTGARLLNYDPKEHENPFWWIVTCEYSSQLDDLFRHNTPEMARDATGGNDQQFNDPFAQPPSIEWDGVDWQRPLEQGLLIAQGLSLTIGANPGGYGPTSGPYATAVLATPETGVWNVGNSDIGLGLVDQNGFVGIIIGVSGQSWVVSGNGLVAGPWTLGGDPTFNSAGSRFDPLPEVDDSRPTLTITRNEIAFDPTIPQLYSNLVNSDYFYGAPPGFAKMRRPRAVSAYENSIYYLKVTYKIDFSTIFRTWRSPSGNATILGWRVAPLDAGYQVLHNVPTNANTGSGSSSCPSPTGLRQDNYRSPVDGSAPAAPVLLDGTGQAAGTPNAIFPCERRPFYRQFSGYRTGPFAPLLLPLNIPQH